MLKSAGVLLGTVISCLLIFDRRFGSQAEADLFAFGIGLVKRADPYVYTFVSFR
jgi:hypothetical protein